MAEPDLAQSLLQAILPALMVAALYASVSAGLSLIWGVTGIVNFAHGEFVMFGGYLTYFAYELYGIHPIFGLFLSALAMGLLGAVVYRTFLRRVLTVPGHNQLLATIEPDELRADRAFYASSAEASSAQVRESEAALSYQERQTYDQIQQAEATLAATVAQRAQTAAELENARANYERNRDLARQGIISSQEIDQARTNYAAATAQVQSLDKQVEAQKAAVAMAEAGAAQVAVKRSQLLTSRQQSAAADAQKQKADVRLAYAEVRAPIAGVVDVDAARVGEVVNPGQAIVTLVNPDDLWARVDVEESYVDQIRLGERLQIRLPSGAEQTGVVYFRGVEAGFATQRDVSRTKRDIKTFEVRLRLDNRERRLAVGMTVYVSLPVNR